MIENIIINFFQSISKSSFIRESDLHSLSDSLIELVYLNENRKETF